MRREMLTLNGAAYAVSGYAMGECSQAKRKRLRESESMTKPTLPAH